MKKHSTKLDQSRGVLIQGDLQDSPPGIRHPPGNTGEMLRKFSSKESMRLKFFLLIAAKLLSRGSTHGWQHPGLQSLHHVYRYNRQPLEI